MSQNLINLFLAADTSAQSLADGIRAAALPYAAAVEAAAAAGKDGTVECAELSAALSGLYAVQRPCDGIADDKARGKAQNLWNATQRRRIVSALSGMFGAAVSVKLDKLRPGMVKVSVTLSVYVESETANFSVRKKLESMLAAVAAFSGDKSGLTLNDSQKSALLAVNAAILAAAAEFEDLI